MAPQIATPSLPIRLGIQQRVLPAYRAPFFELLAGYCEKGVHVFSGQALPVEQIQAAPGLERAVYTRGRNWHLFQPRHPMYLCWQQGLLPWLRSARPDLLVVEANPRYLSSRRAVRWMQERNRPVVGWGLGAPDLAGRSATWRERARRRMIAELDGMIAYSRRGADEYKALGYLPGERIFVAPNAAAAIPQTGLPERNPRPAHPLTVLFVGRMQYRKRVDLLLRAVSTLPSAIRPRLVLVGDGPARYEWENLAQRLSMRARFTGAAYGESLRQHFAAADLFVLPGTGGLAVQQAMSHGLPVIVARGDGTQDDLVRETNGWQVPAGDLAALTQVLQVALEDPGRLRKMGTESYRIVSQEINLQAMAAAFLEALQLILERNRPDYAEARSSADLK